MSLHLYLDAAQMEDGTLGCYNMGDIVNYLLRSFQWGLQSSYVWAKTRSLSQAWGKNIDDGTNLIRLTRDRHIRGHGRNTEQTWNGQGTDTERTRNGHGTDTERTQNGHGTDTERTRNGYGTDTRYQDLQTFYIWLLTYIFEYIKCGAKKMSTCRFGWDHISAQ